MKKVLLKILTLSVVVCMAIAMLTACSGGSDVCTHSNVGDWINDKTATCTVLGARHKECLDCGEKVDEETVLLAGHSFTGGMCSVCRCKQGTDGLEFSKISGKEEYAVSGIGTATETEIVIQTSYNGLPVTAISENAFINSVIESVEIQQGILTVGQSAFENCTALRSVYFGRNCLLESIGDKAFAGCVVLQELEFVASLKNIGASAFAGCAQLYSVSFANDSVFETIGEKAFENCVALASVTLPENIKTISAYAFSGCTSLLTINIPSGLMNFGECAFFGCTEIVVSCGIVAIEKPQGWESKWNDIDNLGTKCQVEWNSYQK